MNSQRLLIINSKGWCEMFVLKLSGIQIDISTNKFHMTLEECTIKNYRMLNARNVNE